MIMNDSELNRVFEKLDAIQRRIGHLETDVAVVKAQSKTLARASAGVIAIVTALAAWLGIDWS